MLGLSNITIKRRCSTSDGIFFNSQKGREDNANHPLNITPYTYPTVDSKKEILHPDVIYISSGWNGYKYWMSYTPMPDAGNDYETPCLAVSNDGINWIDPPGLTNPVWPDPPTGYLADSDIILIDGIMHMVWRDSSLMKVMHSTSSDGITWATPTALLDITNNGGSDYNLLSPAQLYYNGMIYIYSINDLGSNYQLERYSAASWEGPWSVDVCSIDDSMSDLSGESSHKWHVDALYDSGIVLLIMYHQGNDDKLYLYYSEDGISFKVSEKELLHVSNVSWYRSFYRSSMVNVGNAYELYFTGLTTDSDFRIGKALVGDLDSYVRVNNDYSREIIEKWGQEMAKANDLSSGYVFADDFNRPDSETLGTSSCGLVWSQNNSYPYTIGVKGNKAMKQTTGISLIESWVDIGVSNYEATMILGANSENNHTQNLYFISKRLGNGYVIILGLLSIMVVNISLSPNNITIANYTHFQVKNNVINEFAVRHYNGQYRVLINGVLHYAFNLADIGFLPTDGSEYDLQHYIDNTIIGLRYSYDNGGLEGIMIKGL